MSESPQGLRLKFKSRPYSGHPIATYLKSNLAEKVKINT